MKRKISKKKQTKQIKSSFKRGTDIGQGFSYMEIRKERFQVEKVVFKEDWSLIRGGSQLGFHCITQCLIKNSGFMCYTGVYTLHDLSLIHI